MDPISVLFGICLGVIGGAIWVIFTINQWHARAQKLNREWAEFCKEQNDHWLETSLAAIRPASSNAGDERD